MSDSPDLLPVLRLKRNEDKRLRAGHLWVFANEVDNEATPLLGIEPGAQVRVVSHRNQFVGYACVNPHALICARILSRDERYPVGAALIAARLQSALALRSRLYSEPYYRLVYGESDGLPGLVLDRFGDVFVGQIATLGMQVLKPLIEEAVRDQLAPRVLVWKNDSSARDLEKLPHCVESVGGDLPEEVEVLEGAMRLRAPLAGGQKTGWFFDQRANREQLRRFLPPSARVLDVCSYVGGWAVAALHYGAASAICVDSSQSALDAAAANAARNGLALQTRRGDAFDVLAVLDAEGARFDAVILDPPAFVKRKRDLPQGEAAYRRLNQLAMRLIADDGLLVSCSCSYHLPQESMPAIVQWAAGHSGRGAQILAFGGQAPDHPVHPAIPETRYLKAVFCRVTR